MRTYFSDFGLSSKEEKIYLTCLSLGPSPASIIAEKVGVKRPTAYLLLEGLIKQGYISQSSRNGVIQFSAVDPDDLAEVFLQRQRQMSHKIQFFRENISELRAIESKRATQPKIRLFTGKEAIKKLYESLLVAPTWSSFFDISIYESSDIYVDLRKITWDIGYEIRKTSKKPRDIFINCETAREYQQEFQSDYDIRLIDTAPTSADSIFFDDHFFLISYDDGMQLLEVQNEAMTRVQLAMFDGLWAMLEK